MLVECQSVRDPELLNGADNGRMVGVIPVEKGEEGGRVDVDRVHLSKSSVR